MNAGITIYNDQNKIQVDQDYQNLFLINKRVMTGLTATQSFTFDRISMDSIYALSVTPKVADAEAINANYGFSGNILNYADASYKLPTVRGGFSEDGTQLKIILYIPPSFTPPPSGMTVTLYEFSTLRAPSAKYGLNIFNANGDLIFDGLQKPLRVGEFFSTPAIYKQYVKTSYVGSYGAFSRPYKDSTRTYALALLNDSQFYSARFYNSSAGQYTSTSVMGYFHFGFHNSKYRVIQSRGDVGAWDFTESEGMSSFAPIMQCMLIDVTGY